ncbi:MAG TPA: efflux transporter outer membrane subunit [Terracidiphilus sp.]|nr:efflux transporter outer membrane subunit [Terracidiphilus sp.]
MRTSLHREGRLWRRARLQAASPGLGAALLGLAALALAGCRPVGPDYTRPAYTPPPAYKEAGARAAVAPPPNPIGGAWQPASPSDGMLRGKWWVIYNDPLLNSLEERVSANNQTLRAAVERYLAAHDQVTAARADLYPTLTGGVSVAHDKLSANRPLSTSSTARNYNDLVLGGQAAWEPDFWGRVRRSVEAAGASAQASFADAATVDLGLHAELAQDYFELRGLDAQSKLLQTTVRDYEHQLDLTRQLLAGGVATEADVAQAGTQLETARAQMIGIQQARAQFEHAIATLANLQARELTLTPRPLAGTLPAVPLGVPSQLVERRPDIAAAERRVAAANAQIGIAISAFYPTITLGGAGGFESTHGGTWIQGPGSLWSLGAQAAELLFDAGRRRALTSEARHLYEAQAADYKATVLAAFNEVEDKLSDLRVLEQQAEAEQHAVTQAQHSLDLANQRYRGGVTSYLEVLSAENALLQNQRAATDIDTQRFASSVQLIRALGGGWDVTQLPK